MNILMREIDKTLAKKMRLEGESVETLPSFVWDIILYSFTVKELLLISNVCKDWHSNSKKYREWIVKYRDLEYLNPSYYLLSLPPHRLEKEYKNRLLMLNNIKQRSFQQTVNGKIDTSFGPCMHNYHVIVARSKGFAVYNTKTSKVVCEVSNAPGTHFREGKHVNMNSSCDENFVVAVFFDYYQKFSPYIGVWSWNDLLKGNPAPLRYKEFKYAFDTHYNSVEFSAAHNHIVICKQRMSWDVLRFSDLEVRSRRTYSDDPVTYSKMNGNILVTGNNLNGDHTIKAWRVRDDEITLMKTFEDGNRLGSFDIDSKYIMVEYSRGVNIYDRITFEHLRTIEPGTFCFNPSLGLVAILTDYRNTIKCFDPHTGKLVFSEVMKGGGGSVLLFAMTNTGIVHINEFTTISWDFSANKCL